MLITSFVAQKRSSLPGKSLYFALQSLFKVQGKLIDSKNRHAKSDSQIAMQNRTLKSHVSTLRLFIVERIQFFCEFRISHSGYDGGYHVAQEERVRIADEGPML